jgi:putative flippase GtrA
MRLKELLDQYSARIKFIIRYVVTGVVGAFIQIFTIFVWVSILSFEEEYVGGIAIGFGLALLITFFLHKYWTFRNYEHYLVGKQLAYYGVFSLMNFGLNIALLHASKSAIESLDLNFFQIWYLVAQILVVVFVAMISFLSNRYVTFAPSSKVIFPR